MGKEIVYCCKCRRRILGDELDKGSAYQVGNEFTCSTCAVHLLETLPPREKEKLLATMFKETKERQAGPTHSPRSGMPAVAKSASSTGRIHKVAAPARAAAGPPPGRRWGLFAGVGLGVAATIATFIIMGGGGPREDEPKPTGTAAPSRDEVRRKAAADAIRKARDFVQANASDVDRAVTLWQEAVFAADGTPYLADARREHEAAQTRQKDVVRKELADLAEKVRTLTEKEDYKAAQEAVESVRPKHSAAEWTVEVTRTAGSIPDRASKTVAALKEQAAAAVREGDENTAAEIRARILRWGLAPSLADFDQALARVSLPPPLKDAALVAYWHLDEGNGTSVRDASGNGNAAALSGTTWAPGKFGSGLHFDGVQSTLEISPSPELNRLQERDYTLAAWFKPEAIPVAGQESYAIIAKQGFHCGIYFSLNARFYLAQWFDEKGQAVYRQIDGGNLYKPDAFHHIVAVVDWTRGKSTLYVDGVVEGHMDWTRPKAPCMNYGTNPWRVGIAQPGAKEYRNAAKGVINEVRLYSRALTPAEVKVLYKARPAAK